MNVDTLLVLIHHTHITHHGRIAARLTISAFVYAAHLKVKCTLIIGFILEYVQGVGEQVPYPAQNQLNRYCIRETKIEKDNCYFYMCFIGGFYVKRMRQ